MKKKDRKAIAEALASKISIKQGMKKGIFGTISATLSILPKILSVGGKVGGDLHKYTETALEQKWYNTDRLRCLQRLADTLRAHNKQLVICVDDTDKFLKHGTLDWTKIIDPFFVKIIPLLSGVGCATTLSSHTFYDDFSTFRKAIKRHFHSKIQVPRLSYEGFLKVLDRGIQSLIEGCTWEEVIDGEAVKCLYDVYQDNDGDLRETLRFLKDALSVTVLTGASKVTARALFKLLQETHQ